MAVTCKTGGERGEKIFRFEVFGEHGNPVDTCGTFRQNLHSLLDCGSYQGKLLDGVHGWSFTLEVCRKLPLILTLFVIEESIDHVKDKYCKHCRCAGWGQHIVCNKRYLFIIPPSNTLASLEEMEKIMSVDPKNHILHGIFHLNGFGHLVWLSGYEGGSVLPGKQIMDFWDRLCNGLRARNVSLNDLSKKLGMELRLLNVMAYNKPWFGNWGYKFARGSFGVTQSIYEKSIEAIRLVPLKAITMHLDSYSQDIACILTKYQLLSNYTIVTLGDLFHFMLELHARLQRYVSHATGIFTEYNCRWSHKRIKMAIRVIIESLKRAKRKWVSRQHVRDTARAYIGDTGLLDYVLKSLGNRHVGKFLVRRSVNPVTKILEYRLEESPKWAQYGITRPQLEKDVTFLYQYLFKGCNLGSLSLPIKPILNAKFLIKEYDEQHSMKVESRPVGKLFLYCTVLLRENSCMEMELVNQHPTNKSLPRHPIMPHISDMECFHWTVHEANNPCNRWMASKKEEMGYLHNVSMLPFEKIEVRGDTTLKDIKLEVEKNFREVYRGLESLVVESLKSSSLKDLDLVSPCNGPGQVMYFEGRIGNGSCIMDLIFENGFSNRINCICGAKDDDEERMVMCDICQVLQHTICVGIPCEHEVPHVFICNNCELSIMLLPSIP